METNKRRSWSEPNLPNPHRADYKKKLDDVLVKSYNTDKDLFNTYGEVFTLNRSRDDSDKDRDPSTGSDREMKRRKSSKEAESSKDSRSKEKKSLSTSKDASQSQHKSSDKSAHAEEPSHTVDDLGVQLMCTDKLHKFNNGTLNDVRYALHDIAKGIRMEYLPKRKWSGLDKRRARVMIQDINKQLYERRLMRNLEKFIGGREYGNELRLLEQTI
nr:hypothetical protein [Tanacetum cinerariifolium]